MERVKKAAGRKDMKGWFKSGQMVGVDQAVSQGYITNREHAFNLDTLAFRSKRDNGQTFISPSFSVLYFIAHTAKMFA